MSRNDARARVHRAQAEFDAAEHQLAAHWQPWRDRFRHHRLFVLIGGGLLSGLAVAAVSPKHWARIGAALFGGSAWLTRSAIGPAVLGALWTTIRGSSTPARAAAAHVVSPSPRP